MDCQNPGPTYLGFSPEACERAGGTWTPSPCLKLKACIDARPLGNCVEDATIECRKDSKCPVFEKGTGTCSDSTGTATSRCSSDADCPSSECIDILEEDLQTKCEFPSPSFEEFAVGIEIVDASDQSQCRKAREELGFEANSIDDTPACEHFRNWKCEPNAAYEEIDAIHQTSERASRQRPVAVKVPLPAAFASVSFASVDFEDFQGYPEFEETSKKKVEVLGTAQNALTIYLTHMTAMKDNMDWMDEKQSDQAGAYCDITPWPSNILCWIGYIFWVVVGFWAQWVTLQIVHVGKFA